MLQGILADLVALRATITDAKGSKNLDNAIKDLTGIFQSGIWLSSSQLDPVRGKEFFENSRNAVIHLDSVKSKAIGASIQSLLNRILQLSRSLAEEAIFTAAAEGVITDRLTKARHAFASGDKQAVAGKESEAIKNYQEAWSLAQ